MSILTMLMSFFGNIISEVLKDVLKTPGEQIDVINNDGPLELPITRVYDWGEIKD